MLDNLRVLFKKTEKHTEKSFCEADYFVIVYMTPIVFVGEKIKFGIFY